MTLFRAIRRLWPYRAGVISAPVGGM